MCFHSTVVYQFRFSDLLYRKLSCRMMLHVIEHFANSLEVVENGTI